MTICNHCFGVNATHIGNNCCKSIYCSQKCAVENRQLHQCHKLSTATTQAQTRYHDINTKYGGIVPYMRACQVALAQLEGEQRLLREKNYLQGFWDSFSFLTETVDSITAMFDYLTTEEFLLGDTVLVHLEHVADAALRYEEDKETDFRGGSIADTQAANEQSKRNIADFISAFRSLIAEVVAYIPLQVRTKFASTLKYLYDFVVNLVSGTALLTASTFVGKWMLLFFEQASMLMRRIFLPLYNRFAEATVWAGNLASTAFQALVHNSKSPKEAKLFSEGLALFAIELVVQQIRTAPNISIAEQRALFQTQASFLYQKIQTLLGSVSASVWQDLRRHFANSQFAKAATQPMKNAVYSLATGVTRVLAFTQKLLSNGLSLLGSFLSALLTGPLLATVTRYMEQARRVIDPRTLEANYLELELDELEEWVHSFPVEHQGRQIIKNDISELRTMLPAALAELESVNSEIFGEPLAFPELFANMQQFADTAFHMGELPDDAGFAEYERLLDTRPALRSFLEYSVQTKLKMTGLVIDREDEKFGVRLSPTEPRFESADIGGPRKRGRTEPTVTEAVEYAKLLQEYPNESTVDFSPVPQSLSRFFRSFGNYDINFNITATLFSKKGLALLVLLGGTVARMFMPYTPLQKLYAEKAQVEILGGCADVLEAMSVQYNSASEELLVQHGLLNSLRANPEFCPAVVAYDWTQQEPLQNAELKAALFLDDFNTRSGESGNPDYTMWDYFVEVFGTPDVPVSQFNWLLNPVAYSAANRDMQKLMDVFAAFLQSARTMLHESGYDPDPDIEQLRAWLKLAVEAAKSTGATHVVSSYMEELLTPLTPPGYVSVPVSSFFRNALKTGQTLKKTAEVAQFTASLVAFLNSGNVPNVITNVMSNLPNLTALIDQHILAKVPDSVRERLEAIIANGPEYFRDIADKLMDMIQMDIDYAESPFYWGVSYMPMVISTGVMFADFYKARYPTSEQAGSTSNSWAGSMAFNYLLWQLGYVTFSNFLYAIPATVFLYNEVKDRVMPKPSAIPYLQHVTVKKLEANVTKTNPNADEVLHKTRRRIVKLERENARLREQFENDVEFSSDETEVEDISYNPKKRQFEKKKKKKITRTQKISAEEKETLRKAADKALQWERMTALLTKPAPDLVNKS